MSLNLSTKQKILFDILYTPLMGKEITVLSSNNENLVGIRGVILLETAQFLHVETKSGGKKLKKNQVTISLDYNSEQYFLDCSLLHSTLPVRLKKFK